MFEIASSLATNLITVVCFVAIAYAGIVLGKKYRDKKDSETK